MDRNVAGAWIKGAGERCAGSTCWSGEWSFIEDHDAASRKQAQLPFVEKQPAAAVGNGMEPCTGRR